MEWKLPRRMRLQVSVEKKLSTAFNQASEVGGEMEDPARVPSELYLDLGMLMSGVVIEDGVDRLVDRHRALDGIE